MQRSGISYYFRSMFFIVSKIFSFLISPLVWVFGLLLFALLTKNSRRSRRLLIAAVVTLYLCSNSFLVDELYRWYEPVTTDHDLQKTQFEGAIILGGLGDIDLRIGKITFGIGADRLLQTLPLYHQHRIKKIIFSGGSGSLEFPEKREGLFIQKYLRSIDIPDSSLLIESKSRNTYENARFTKVLFDSLHLTGKYLLVTSAFHMRRAMAAFKKQGFENLEPYITNKVSGVRRFTLDHLFIPDPGAVIALETLLHEWLGFITYKIRGYA